jgi:hypothetical protein
MAITFTLSMDVEREVEFDGFQKAVRLAMRMRCRTRRDSLAERPEQRCMTGGRRWRA